MKKRILTFFLAALLVFSVIPGAVATETEETTAATKPVRGEFECGDGLTWAYDAGVLTVTGNGPMDDYAGDEPWAAYRDEMEAVIFTGGVTYIGARAFYNYDSLKSVDFGAKLKEIGEEAFYSCEGLTEIELPSTFKIFGPSSFMSCKNLKEIHCEGVFPSFKLNCLWDVHTKIYYPESRPWQVSLIAQLEEAFKGRIEFLASDGTDHYTPEETKVTEVTEVTETTEAPTETTAPTEVTTEATEVAAETTVPSTAAPETAVPVQTEPVPTVPAETVPRQEKDLLPVVGLGAVVVVLLAVILVLVVRRPKKGGKYAK